MVVLVRLSARVRLPSQVFPASRCPTVQPRVRQHSRPAAGMRSLLSLTVGGTLATCDLFC